MTSCETASVASKFIPEESEDGQGNGWLFFRLFASTILAGASRVGVGGQEEPGEARPRKRPQGLDGDAVRRAVQVGRIEKRPCAAFQLANRVSAVFGPVSSVGQAAAGHSFAT